MNPRPTGRVDDSGWYEIRLGGRLDPRWSTWLDGVRVTAGADGTTVLTGYLADQSALHGLLSQRPRHRPAPDLRRPRRTRHRTRNRPSHQPD